MLEHGMVMYDALYTWCRSLQTGTHNWPLQPRSRRAVAELKAIHDRSDVCHKISLREAFPTWLRVGGLSFGVRRARSRS